MLTNQRKFCFTGLIGLILLINIPVAAQNQADNLAKYWRYRDRLRNEFVYVSSYVEEFGNNLPGCDRYTQDGISRLSWGDANNMMNHYLTVLATELWLLKSNEQPYQQTLSELTYAMIAIERL